MVENDKNSKHTCRYIPYKGNINDLTSPHLPDKECLHVGAVILGKALVLVGEREGYLLFTRFVDDVLLVFPGASLTNTSCMVGREGGRGRKEK